MFTKDQALKMGTEADGMIYFGFILHILGDLCVLELDPVQILLGQYSA